MNDLQDDKKAVFTISVGDIQEEAICLIGRRLSCEELMKAADAVEWGLCEGKSIVFNAAIRQAIEINNNRDIY